jgi:hypothetical protein
LTVALLAEMGEPAGLPDETGEEADELTGAAELATAGALALLGLEVVLGLDAVLGLEDPTDPVLEELLHAAIPRVAIAVRPAHRHVRVLTM